MAQSTKTEGAIKAGDFRLGFASSPAPAEGRGFDLLGLAD